MHTFQQYQKLANLGPHIVILGNFDGVHQGHQVLIHTALQQAKFHKCTSLVMTFNPHPLRFFKGDHGPKALYSVQDRKDIFLHMGIDRVLLQRFDQEFAKLSPWQFFHDVLLTSLHAHTIVVGYDFAFGAKRAGAVADLQRWGIEHNISVIVVEPQYSTTHNEIENDLNKTKVYSSTWIRNLVSQGAMQNTMHALGREYHIRGWVVKGYQRGRTIGFPTANIALESEICPAAGVYAGFMDWGIGPQKVVISIGSNPTFKEHHRLLAQQTWSFEVHILQQKHDLYDKQVIVWITHYLRAPHKFDHIEELKVQIKKDCEASTSLLVDYHPMKWPHIN
jgi:riboflavin kinase / FMN adenylyltransferase